MAEWVDVNGARVEMTYLKENIAEARGYRWTASSSPVGRDHIHCLVCLVAIAEQEPCFEAAEGFCCSYCFEHFVSPQKLPSLENLHVYPKS